jgi:Peptidase family S41
MVKQRSKKSTARAAGRPADVSGTLAQAQRGELLSDALAAAMGETPAAPPPPSVSASLAAEPAPTPPAPPAAPVPVPVPVPAMVGHLDGGQRQQVLDALITVLGGAYAHLPAKRAAYAVNPVQQLALLRQRAGELTDADFHLQVTAIVTGLRDAHTRYIGPSPLRGVVAVLPFLIEEYGPFDEPTFMVTKTVPAALADVEGGNRFRPGVVVESWNGIPIARAVDVYADRQTGGRPDARRAWALESLTFRALDFEPPPDEQWVVLGYRDGRTRREIRLDWRVVRPGKAETAAVPESRTAAKQAINPSGEAVRRAKKLLFSPDLWSDEHNAVTPVPAEDRPVARADLLPTSFPDNLAARALPGGEVGYLRVWSFDLEDDDAFLAEVQGLLEQLPQQQLIVDLRANPGGLVWAAERMLQLFVDPSDPRRQPIRPARFSLVASPLTRDMAASPFNRLELEAWSPSLEDSISTGEQYAQPLPLTDPDWCNDLDYHYPGTAVAVVDAMTYSSGDLFSAGWVDNSIGDLLVVGRATGAGGANVWTSGQLRDALTGTSHAFEQLPAGVGFTLAIRRAIRSAAGDGLPIEDLGISGIPYSMTRSDIEDGNRDLLAFCTKLLEQPK